MTTRQTVGVVLLVLGMLIPLINTGLVAVLKSEVQHLIIALSLVGLWITAIGVWWWLGKPPGMIPFRLRLSKADAVVAVLAGFGGLALIPVLSMLAAQWLAPTNLLESVGRIPVWLVIAGVITAAVTEEVLYRAASMELLLRSGVPSWLSVTLPLIAFVICHAGNWSLAHLVGVVIPMGLLLALVYLWRRNLLVNIIIHGLIDAPLIVVALSTGT